MYHIHKNKTVEKFIAENAVGPYCMAYSDSGYDDIIYDDMMI